MAGALLLIVIARSEQRRRFNHCFSDSDYRLVYSLDGEDAFDRFAEVRPDLVIAYEHAPRLDGALLCRLIRQQGGAQLPFVMLADAPVTEERLAASSIDAAITWPFEPSELLALVRRLLEGPKRRVSFPPLPAVAMDTAVADDTISLDLEDPAPNSVLLDDQSDDIPTSPREVPLVGIDLLEEPIAPLGLREALPDEVTAVQLNPEFLDLFEEHDASGSDDDARDPPLVSPVSDDSLEADPLPSAPAGALDGDLSGTTTESARKRALLEEPPLPGPADLGPFSRGEPSVRVSRPTTDSMIREIPRDVTPTGERPSVPDERPDGRVGRGLDESQLGRRLTRRVQQLHRLIGELDHYQILGLEPGVTRSAIDEAYFELCIEFHPDRFFLLRSGPLKQQIFEIFHRLNAAYETISDPERRADYDRSRASSVPAAPAAPILVTAAPPAKPSPESPTQEDTLLSVSVDSSDPSAKVLVDLARSALDDQDRNGARLYLSMAMSIDSANEGVRALLEAVVAQGAGLRPVPPIP